MNKKGMELSITALVVIIIAVAVLAVVLIMFMAGTGGTWSRIKEAFFGVTAGTDRALAVQDCKFYCKQAELLPVETIHKSTYCTKYFHIDENNDGEADKDKEGYIRFYCGSSSIMLDMNRDKHLGVSCAAAKGCKLQ